MQSVTVGCRLQPRWLDRAVNHRAGVLPHLHPGPWTQQVLPCDEAEGVFSWLTMQLAMIVVCDAEAGEW